MLFLVFKNVNKFVKLPKIVNDFRRYKKYISLYKERVKTNDSAKKINNAVKNDKNPVNNSEITEKFSFLQSTNNILPTSIDNIYNIFNILCNTEPNNTSSDTVDNPQTNQKNSVIYINIYLNLNINNISIKGNLILPNPNNYRRKIFVMCDRDEEEYALQCGATYTSESYLDKVVNNSAELEDLIIISSNLHLPKLLKYSKILGPKKLLPNKHMGTLCNNIYEGIKRVRSNNFLQYYIETIEQSEFNQILSTNSHIDPSELNQKNMCKIRVPISIIENGLKELVENIRFFIEYLKINNLSNRKVQVNTNTLGNFVYPPPRNLSLSPTDETNDSRENIISHMALDLKNYNHLLRPKHLILQLKMMVWMLLKYSRLRLAKVQTKMVGDDQNAANNLAAAVGANESGETLREKLKELDAAGDEQLTEKAKEVKDQYDTVSNKFRQVETQKETAYKGKEAQYQAVVTAWNAFNNVYKPEELLKEAVGDDEKTAGKLREALATLGNATDNLREKAQTVKEKYTQVKDKFQLVKAQEKAYVAGTKTS